MSAPAVFLDRDGVIVREVDYLSRRDDVELIGDAARAINLINQHGLPVVIITNQAGVARGYYPESQVRELNAYLINELSKKNAQVLAVYFCPHHPTAGKGIYLKDCDFRKPKPGMLLKASKELDLDLHRSVLIGDNFSDILAGKNAGTKTILVKTGHGQRVLDNPDYADLQPDAICDDLISAVQHSIDSNWI